MSKTIRILILVVVTAALSFPVAATAAQLLNVGEEAHLIFMRSEEKLARDVYLKLAELYPEAPVFYNIATQAEQTHTDTMRDTLLKFGLEDPEPSTEPATLPPYEQIGVFENPYFAEYFTDKFTALIISANTLLNALYVGAKIEELDMKDINECNDVICVAFPEIALCECGLKTTNVQALENTLGNLLNGSKNHLCTFISQIGPIIQSPEDPLACYEAQYLTQQEVWNYIAEQCPEFLDTELGLKYVCKPPDEPPAL
ncbi:MAG: DUF2202 domain-containing protein [Desulfobulbaceae bacterium]|nr:DUF2202 domain-containing protein [Desulfobulbaceae bacterium]